MSDKELVEALETARFWFLMGEGRRRSTTTT